MLLHNQGTDTLSKSISEIVSSAKGKVKINYFTPYMNKTGILNFCDLLSKKTSLSDIEFRTFTNKPNLSYVSGTFLKSEDIQNIKRTLGKFVLLKRKTKNGGTILSDGTEISNDFLHLKLIHISFKNKKGMDEQHSIFTSANLTGSVWARTGDNLEIGLWVRDHVKNLVIDSFIESFSACFSEPDEAELNDIDQTMDEIEQRNNTREVWIEDFLEDRLVLNNDSIKIDWENFLPKIKDIKCKLVLRNLITGEVLEEIVNLKKSTKSFFGKIDCLVSKKNTIIDYLEMVLDTKFKPPEIEIKSDCIKDFLVQREGKFFFQFKNGISND